MNLTTITSKLIMDNKQFNAALLQSGQAVKTFAIKSKVAATGVSTAFKGMAVKVSASLKMIGTQMLATFGGVTSIFLLISVFKDFYNVVKDFELGMAKVKAITGETDEAIKKLTKSARNLAKTSIFQASEVAQLQLEYAKLGSKTEQIISATQATIDLATAMDDDLGTTANSVGSSIKAMGLDFDSTTEMVDLMAAAFSNSALDLSKWTETMKYVAPIARATGIEVEQLAGMMSVLANRGIHGSMAGTSLKRIISELGDGSGTLEEKFADLAKEGLNLSGANDEVGRRAKASLLVLVNSTKELKEYGDTYRDVGGTVKKMAAEIMNTVEGQQKALGSAIHEMWISIGQGDAMKEALKALTDLVAVITAGIQAVKKLSGKMGFLKDSLMMTIKPATDFFKILGIINARMKDTEKKAEKAAEAFELLAKNSRLPIEQSMSFIKFGDSDFISTQRELKSKVEKTWSDLDFVGLVELQKTLGDFKKGDSLDVKKYNSNLVMFNETIEKLKGNFSYIDEIQNQIDRKEIELLKADTPAQIKKVSEDLDVLYNNLVDIKDLSTKDDFTERLKNLRLRINTSKSLEDISRLREELILLKSKRDEIFSDSFTIGESSLKLGSVSSMPSLDFSSIINPGNVEKVKIKIRSAYSEFGDAIGEGSKQIEEQTIQIGGMLAGLAGTIGQGLKAAFQGATDPFGNFLADLGEMMISFGSSLIALALAELSLETGNVPAMLIGGAALITAGAYLASTRKDMQGLSFTGGGVGGGGGRQVTQPIYEPYDYNRDITLTAKGSDLVAVMNKTNKRTYGNG